jgi:hypothetical protein
MVSQAQSTLAIISDPSSSFSAPSEPTERSGAASAAYATVATAAVPAAEEEAVQQVAMLTSNTDLVEGLLKFIQASPACRLPKFHVGIGEMLPRFVDKVVDTVSTSLGASESGELTFTCVMTIAGVFLDQLVLPEWVQLAANVMLISDNQVATLHGLVFGSHTDAANLIKTKCAYMVLTLKEAFGEDGPCAKNADAASILSVLKNTGMQDHLVYIERPGSYPCICWWCLCFLTHF